jgi:hypothetical protein
MNWELARKRWESDPDTTQADIAELMSCTQQAVSLRMKKEQWERPDQELVSVVSNLPTFDNTSLGKRTPTNMAQAAEVFSISGNKSLAAQSIGVHRNTFSDWLNDDAEYAQLLAAKRAQFLGERVQHIATAKDWKASAFLLARDKATREQYGEHASDKGPTIILNIQRSDVDSDGIVIDGETCDI